MIFGVFILEIVKILEIKINVLKNLMKKFCGKFCIVGVVENKFWIVIGEILLVEVVKWFVYMI